MPDEATRDEVTAATAAEVERLRQARETDIAATVETQRARLEEETRRLAANLAREAAETVEAQREQLQADTRRLADNLAQEVAGRASDLEYKRVGQFAALATQIEVHTKVLEHLTALIEKDRDARERDREAARTFTAEAIEEVKEEFAAASVKTKHDQRQMIVDVMKVVLGGTLTGVSAIVVAIIAKPPA